MKKILENMSNLDKYFIWERPCFPGLVFIGFESANLPHKKEFGRPWSDVLSFFSNGMTRAVININDMTQNGVYITENFLNKNYYQEKMERYDKLTKNLFDWFGKIDSLDLKKLSDQELLELHKNYNLNFLEWWGFAQVSDVIGMGAEYMLKQGRNISNEQMSILSTPTQKSYTTIEEEEILLITKYILSKPELVNLFKNTPDFVVNEMKQKYLELYNLFKIHSQKYFWLLNSYSETKYLDILYFVNSVKNILAETDKIDPAKIDNIINNNQKRLEEYKISILNIEDELKFIDREKKLVEFIDYFSCFQDDRKAYSLKANHYTDLFIHEIARRSGLSYDLVKFLIPQDYESVLNSTFELSRIKQRQKHFALLYKDSGLEILEGDDSLNAEQELLGHEVEDDITEFEGVRAMGGKVIGKVRKILQLSELNTMESGEILVTSMTSPDFIVAMKKAKAIITDQGGVTCHAAVISRELGIPCVIGTSIATRVLNTGDLVEVRANHGVIKIIEKIK